MSLVITKFIMKNLKVKANNSSLGALYVYSTLFHNSYNKYILKRKSEVIHSFIHSVRSYVSIKYNWNLKQNFKVLQNDNVK